MKRPSQGVVALLLLAFSSCFSLPNPVPNEVSHQKPAEDSIPVVRLGMTSAEVEAKMGRGVLEDLPGFGPGRAFGVYRDVRVEYLYDKVISTSSRKYKILESERPILIPDYLLEKVLHRGLTSTETAALLGAPRYGYENKPGSITFMYPRAGLEVEFVDDALLRSKQVYTYAR